MEKIDMNNGVCGLCDWDTHGVFTLVKAGKKRVPICEQCFKRATEPFRFE